MTTYNLTINRKQTLKQAIDSIRPKIPNIYISSDAVLPNKGAKKVKVELFHVGTAITVFELNQEYEKRNLVPDPFALIALIKKHPKIWDNKKFLAVQMPDFSYVAFRRWLGERGVYCSHGGRDWYAHWWFAGVRKSLEARTLEVLPELLEVNGARYQKVV